MSVQFEIYDSGLIGKTRTRQKIFAIVCMIPYYFVDEKQTITFPNCVAFEMIHIKYDASIFQITVLFYKKLTKP